MKLLKLEMDDKYYYDNRFVIIDIVIDTFKEFSEAIGLSKHQDLSEKLKMLAEKYREITEFFSIYTEWIKSHKEIDIYLPDIYRDFYSYSLGLFNCAKSDLMDITNLLKLTQFINLIINKICGTFVIIYANEDIPVQLPRDIKYDTIDVNFYEILGSPDDIEIELPEVEEVEYI